MPKNKIKSRVFCWSLCFCFLTTPLLSQDDLLSALEEEQEATTQYTFATFKGTRAINLQSNELPAQGVLQYIFIHRFGAFSDDYFYNNLGLNTAEVALQLDYGVTDWFNAGLSMGTASPRTYSGFLKFKILRQSKGAKNMPFSLSSYSSITYNNEKYNLDVPYNNSDRVSYNNQLIIARKFSKNFSMEIVPTHVHFNLVSLRSEDNDIFSVGFAARQKITQQLGLSIEYIYQINPLSSSLGQLGSNITIQDNQNVLSVGVDIETGGHVFQIFLTNSRGIADPYTIAQTPEQWKDGAIHLGFNISRVFTIYKPKLPEGE